MSAEILKAARILLGESQADFAAHFGIDQGTLSRWEANGIPTQGAAPMLINLRLEKMREQFRKIVGSSRGGPPRTRAPRDGGER